MLKILIVDDEFKGREYLKQMLEKHCAADIGSIELADSYEQAMNGIRNMQPDVLMLDIEMPFKSGFDVLEQSGNRSFEVIFTTAFNQYAIKAIRYNALDYLLKPVDKDELIAAIQKVKGRILNKEPQQNIGELLKQLKTAYNKQIGLPTITGITFINLQEIIRFEASGNYTQVVLENNRRELICRTLKEVEESVDGLNFLRVHKSHIVSMNHILEYQKSDGGYVLMKDKTQVPVSRNQKDELLKRINVI